MDSFNKQEKTDNNEIQNMIEKMYTRPQVKNKISSKGIKGHMITVEDKKIDAYVHSLILGNDLTITQFINVPLDIKTFDGHLFSYAIQKINKNENESLYLIHSLKFYDTFNNLLTKILNDEEKIFLFSQIISKIKIEQKKANDILFKIGDISERFYFLLNGSTTKLTTYKYNVMMDKYEYYIYMKYLYKIDELELFNLTLIENEEIFDKFELLHYILKDKNFKYHHNVIIQLKNMEASYVSQRINANHLNEYNFNNTKTIIISQKKYKTEDIIKGDYIISCLDEHIKHINVPIEEYINNLKPINLEEEDEDLIKKKLTLHLYKIENTINVGMHLEELEQHGANKKESTIICNSDCVFGYIHKKDYYSCLKITQTKFHRNDINFLLENELFSSLSFSDFDRNYYHLFELTKKYQNQILFQQKKKNDYIYFLKHGEVSVSLEGNINDLYRIIGLKGGPKNRKILDVNYIKRFYSIDLDNHIFEKNNIFSLLKVNENFPIGLEDFLDEENDNKQLFSVHCNMDSEVLAIKKEDLKEIAYRERDVFKIKEKYIIKRKNLLIEKLNNLKNGLIQKYIYEKYKIKAMLPELFQENALSPRKKNNQERYDMGTPRRKNDLSYIDTKFNGRSFIEITSALKLKENKELCTEGNEICDNQKNNNNSENEITNNETTINENIKSSDTINTLNTNENDKTSTNVVNNQNKTINRIKKKRASLRMPNIKDMKMNKVNQEILDLIKSPNFNQIIKLNKNKKDVLDPLDRIYKRLKYPSISYGKSKSIKHFPNDNSINSISNKGYEITSFNVLTPLKPHRFIPNNRKIILPQKPPINGYFSKKMKEIKLFKTITQDKSSVILKTETAPHNLYFDNNNNLIATLNFNKNRRKNTKDKKMVIFNNIKINNSINYKISQSLDKKSNGVNTDNSIHQINKNEKTLLFPKINYISINKM